jgi:hypothetical protein
MRLAWIILPEGIRAKVEGFGAVVLVARPSPKTLARIHPARRVSRWRTPALSAGSPDQPHRAFATFLADRLAIGETELIQSNRISL